MADVKWTEVDRYLEEQLIARDEDLDKAIEASTRGGLPAIQVSATQGKLLYLYVRMLKARRVLEIGTLGGYSSIWMAKALKEVSPDGRLITLEISPKHADVAKANFVAAGLHRIIELRLGPAMESLKALQAETASPFDVTFIDADKASIADYFNFAITLSRPGSLIVCDNVVRNGSVTNANSQDPNVLGTRRLAEMMGRDPRVSATAIQTVGCKGYDGFAVALVL